jgi:replicative DNA helicase
VDYLQLVKGRNLDNRVQEVAEISQGLKNLARELKIPVVAMSQLSRNIEHRGAGSAPQLSDLRESGSIEQDADVVMFIVRPSMYDPEVEDPRRAELIVAKQRNGPTGQIDLVFQHEYTRFENADFGREEGEAPW